MTVFDTAFASLPLVAILRGLRPQEAEDIGAALYAAGFRLIEVPLNSPEPFDSIARLARSLPADAVIGAGTVLQVEDVARVRDAGGQLIVMPHADVEVIRAAKAAGMYCVPGVATPTEAFAASKAGADALKLFPAELVTPAIVKAMRAVLPPRAPFAASGWHHAREYGRLSRRRRGRLRPRVRAVQAGHGRRSRGRERARIRRRLALNPLSAGGDSRQRITQEIA